MNGIDILLVIVLLVVIGLAVRKVYRDKKYGRPCCGGCAKSDRAGQPCCCDKKTKKQE